MTSILVLEDEAYLMKLLRKILKEHTVLEAATAEEAIRIFKDNSSSVALLIADVSLPVGSGIQTALILRSQVPDLPVILTSGYPASSWSVRDFADLGRLGSDSVSILQKPFQPAVLLHAVRNLVRAPRQLEVARTSAVR